MRRVAWTVAALAWYVVLADPSAAAKRYAITFDAATRKLAPVAAVARQGDTLRVRIVNPNVFRETYSINCRGVDLHAVSLPDPLKSLLATGTDVTEGLPMEARMLNVTTTAPTLASGALTTAMSLDKAAKPPDPLQALRAACDTALVAFSELEREVLATYTSSPARDVSGILTRALVAARNDASARAAALDQAVAVCDSWGDSAGKPTISRVRAVVMSDDPGPNDVADVNAALSQMLTDQHDRAANWQARWEQVLAVWQDKRDAWGAKHAESKDLLAAAGAFDARVQTAARWMASLKDKMNAVERQLQSFTAIAGAAVDPLRAPTVIERDAIAQDDEVLVQVVATSRPLVAADVAGTPQADVVTRDAVVQVRGRWVVDATAGFAMTSLLHRNYFARPDSSTPSRVPVAARGVSDRDDPAPAVFAALTWTQHTGRVFWAIVPAALGLTAASPPRYLAGLGLQVGKRVRLSALGGCAWGQVEALNNVDATNHLPASSSIVDVKSVMRRGHWAAVGLTVSLPERGKGGK